MDCDHYAARRCRSCRLLEVPRLRQVHDKEAHARAVIPATRWLPAATGDETGFRNKSKMVVGGSAQAPTLGILDDARKGVDLRDCAIQEPGLRDALDVIAAFIARAALPPYDVASRSGELKHVLVTHSPDGELMLRLVLRSTATEARVRKHLGWLVEQLATLRVVSLNIQPEHKAVLEGDREIVLTGARTLPMRLDTGITLHLGPQSFFQTNTRIAEQLYAQARDWVAALAPRRVWDLYCGVGGFALHLAAAGREVVGVEVSAEAIASAEVSAAEAAVGASFVAGDATAYALGHSPTAADLPDVVVVNPPRRGIGTELADWLERSSVPHVVYSSCNAESLARDLSAMPSLRPVEGRVLDMFPHTHHYEVVVLLSRQPAPAAMVTHE